MNFHATDTHHQHTPRIEDQALVTGAGRFVDDAATPGQAYAAFVRSPHAFARLRSIDFGDAHETPGVVAVLTAADMMHDAIDNVSRHPPMDGRNGSTLVRPPRPALADERVVHVGQAIAMVVARSRTVALDAAEMITVEYEELEPAVDLAAAAEGGAAQIWPDAKDNVALEWIMPQDEGTIAQVKQTLASAHKVARVKFTNQRLVVASMETRGATASYDHTKGRYTLRVCSQGPRAIAEQTTAAMGLKPEQLRVYSEDVGGAFGMKTPLYPEYVCLLVAAKLVGCPVHWMSTRSEAFLSDNQARDTITEAALALDADGKFLALHVQHAASMGAYVTSHGAHIQTNNFSRCFPAMYDIPAVGVEVRCLFTNTLPTGPYRGAGRPEANYILERLVEEAARVTGIDRVELRRKNLIPPAKMPYKTPVGTTYDSGDFAPVLDKALQLAGYSGFAARRAVSEANGKRRGFGISCFLEHSGGVPTEGASMTFKDDEPIQLGLGLHSTGQGHASVFARLAAERLQIAPEQVRVRQGDTALDVAGYASVASRGAMTVSHAVVRVVDVVLEKGRKAASAILEASEQDINYRDGHFEVVGTDRRLSLFDAAHRAKGMVALGLLAEDLDSNIKVDTPQTFPNGCHIAEVEIDPDSGVATIVGYSAVDDCGNVLDHMIIEGQVHGAVAQGLGQALMENAVYDPASGQLIAGSFMDYAMPRAHHMPDIKDGLHLVPATTNPLGVKGVGEAGTTASLAAIMNAIADALPDGAAASLDMPATTEKIWRACQRG
ncbi:MAG TPA: xanthine dehydrogenase family protein molybdopterin-binding subunit [Xanthobacteraceae bacterium]